MRYRIKAKIVIFIQSTAITGMAPPERIFASGFEISDRPDEQNNELQSDTFLCHRNPQREVSVSMPEVTDEQYLNAAEIRQPIVSVHT